MRSLLKNTFIFSHAIFKNESSGASIILTNITLSLQFKGCSYYVKYWFKGRFKK